MEKFKSFYNKENFDYSDGLVDPLQYHCSLELVMKSFGITYGKKPPLWSIIFFSLAVIVAIFTLLCSGLAFYHGFQEINIFGLTEMGSYIILSVYELMILSTSKRDIKHLNFLLTSIHEDFEKFCSTKLYYRKAFFDHQLGTWKICVFLAICMGTCAITLVVFTLLLLFYYLATHPPGDRANRPLQFGLWAFDIDLHATPYYEVMFVYTNCATLLFSFSYIYFSHILLVWIRQITCKANFIIYSLNHLLDDFKATRFKEERKEYESLIQMRLRDIVLENYSMYELLDHFASVYKKMFMYEQMFCAFAVSLTAYGTAQGLQLGEFQGALALVCVATLIATFIPAYFCTYLLHQLRSIADACIDVPFWNLGHFLRPYLVLIIQRSLRPLPLQASGFEEVSLKTYSAKMTSAYSIFNMLRRLDW